MYLWKYKHYVSTTLRVQEIAQKIPKFKSFIQVRCPVQDRLPWSEGLFEYSSRPYRWALEEPGPFLPKPSGTYHGKLRWLPCRWESWPLSWEVLFRDSPESWHQESKFRLFHRFPCLSEVVDIQGRNHRFSGRIRRNREAHPDLPVYTLSRRDYYTLCFTSFHAGRCVCSLQ